MSDKVRRAILGVPTDPLKKPEPQALVEAIEEIEESIAGAAAGLRQADTWSALSALTGSAAGQPGRSLDTGGGTHTDPVVGGSVPNQGEFTWSTSPAGWKYIGPLLLTGKASEAEALAGTDDTKAMTPLQTTTVVDAAVVVAVEPINTALMEHFRAVMWDFLGDGDPDLIPIEANDLGYVLQSRNASDGRISGSDDAARDAFRAVMWLFLGDGDVSEPPDTVNDLGYVLTTKSAVTGDPVLRGQHAAPNAMAYIDAGELHLIGPAGGDTALNDDADKIWLAATSYFGSCMAVYQDTVGGARHTVRVSYSTGSIYPDGEISLHVSHGQSNGEGQAQELAQALRRNYPYPDLLMMPDLGPWLGMATVGGTSVEFDPDDFEAFVPMGDRLSGAGHGTVQAMAGAYAYAQRTSAECGGWVSRVLALSLAEGGQSIANLLSSAVPPYYSFDNDIAFFNKAQDIASDMGFKLNWRRMDMHHGESDVSNASLGAQQELARSQRRAAITQDAPLRMLTAQASSFLSDSTGARSILSYFIANKVAGGNFWLMGPTFPFDWSADFLHHASRGHRRIAEFREAVWNKIEQLGEWSPPYMTAASVTGTNEITVTMSEAVVNDEASTVAAITNKGVAVVGKTVSAVSVVGSSVIITTTAAAAGATAVQLAMVGHSGTRTAATIPRTTIRAVASPGVFTEGDDMHAFAGHQEIAIT